MNASPLEPPLRLNYQGVHCSLMIEHVAPRLVLITISGSDVGEFGQAPMLALQQRLASLSDIDLYIDARAVRGATVDVSAEWSAWMARERAKFRAITMLTGSAFVRITAQFVQRFAELGDIMRVCTDARVFEQALDEARQRR